MTSIDNLKNKWNEQYGKGSVAEAQAAEVLKRYSHLLPKEGDALDLACGLGGNALLMAKHGLNTEAWDISDTAVDRLNDYADAEKLSLKARIIDVEQNLPEADSLDVLIVSHFLYRPHLLALAKSLRPEGVLFYQTFTQERLEGASGPKNPKFLLEPNELLATFKDLRVLAYREDGLVGDVNKGVRNIAMLVAQRTANFPV